MAQQHGAEVCAVGGVASGVEAFDGYAVGRGGVPRVDPPNPRGESPFTQEHTQGSRDCSDRKRCPDPAATAPLRQIVAPELSGRPPDLPESDPTPRIPLTPDDLSREAFWTRLAVPRLDTLVQGPQPGATSAGVGKRAGWWHDGRSPDDLSREPFWTRLAVPRLDTLVQGP